MTAALRGACALAAVALLAGCAASPAAAPGDDPSGGSSVAAAAPATASDASACALVTEAEAAVALGFDPGPGSETTSYDATSCVFGSYPQMITVNLAPSAGKAGYTRLDVAPSVGTFGELSGIGDAAFGVVNAPVATIEFLHGDAVVAIVVVADGSQDNAIALAQAANGRL